MGDDARKLHSSVMLDEVLDYLDLQARGIYVDGTLGMGGHTESILQKIGAEGCVIAIDHDQEALTLAKSRLTNYEERCRFHHSNYYGMPSVLRQESIDRVDGILLDLGVSSFQIDNAERGFSIRADGPLDMRMNPDEQITAYDLINSLSEKELARILRNYGEEKFSGRIARHIVTARNTQPIETTYELSQLVLRAVPFKKGKRDRIHPATRTFQAFRIAVNRELDVLSEFLEDGVQLLKPGGRLVIISFHSLEDRIVKHRFRELSKMGVVEIITKKPIYPTENEISENARARSARLRVVEKI